MRNIRIGSFSMLQFNALLLLVKWLYNKWYMSHRYVNELARYILIDLEHMSADQRFSVGTLIDNFLTLFITLWNNLVVSPVPDR